MNKSFLTEKTAFFISLLVFSFLYGAGVGKWGWFPSSFLDQAVNQARNLNVTWVGSPSFLRSQIYSREGVRIPQSEKVQSGPTFITSSWRESDGWNPELRLLDREGNILHRWRVERGDLFEEQGIVEFKKKVPSEADIQGADLLPKGDVLFNLNYVGLVRMNACGKVEWTLKEGTHHSVEQAEDGTFWVPGVSPKPRAETEQYEDGFPGFSDRNVWIDRILQVSGEGEILTDINVLDLLYRNDLERLLFRYGGKRDTHLNDIEPLSANIADEYPLFEAGDLLLSLRNVNVILVLNPESKDIKWHAAGPFIGQHDPDFLGGGWIGVFDNNTDGTKRGTVLGGSRIVVLQPHTDSVDVRFPTQHSERFYTDRRGYWQQLPNGNMLLTETRAGRVVEVDPEGRTVWEWVHESDNSRVPSVTKAHRHDLTQEEISSWSCSGTKGAR